MRRAVISFFNVSSGRYRWWDEFPLMIGQQLAPRGIDHICFYRDYEETSPHPADRRHPAPDGSLADARWLEKHVRPIAAKYEQVIFHTHGYYRPIELWRETRHHPRAKWFWTEHQISEPRRFDFIRKLGRCAGQRLGRFPSRLFGVSKGGEARLKQQFSASSVQCIRTGIRITEPANLRERETGYVPRKALFVGRMLATKGIWPLLESMTILRANAADVHLTIVGRGMAEEVEAFIRKNDLSGQVTLAGHQLDVEPFYRDADFVIIPTLVREALGMVSLEARLHRLPVIYSNRGGLPETQIEGITGIKLTKPTAEEIAAAVMALRSDPARYAGMRRQAPQGLAEFSIDAMVQQYVNQYEPAFSTF